jgi:hypothetical protein
VLEQGCATLLQGHEVSGFVGDAVEPAAVQDANPLEGQGAQRGLVVGAASARGDVPRARSSPPGRSRFADAAVA